MELHNAQLKKLQAGEENASAGARARLSYGCARKGEAHPGR